MAEANDQRVGDARGLGAGGMSATREIERRAIDMWAPIVPVPEVMHHVAQHFPKEMAGYLRVFYKREPDPREFERAAARDADERGGPGRRCSTRRASSGP